MGKVDPMFYHGRIGPVIHYQMGNGYYMRSMPKKFKQTKATKERAAEFGLASTIGTSIRRILSPIMSETPDLKTRGRLVGVVFAWLRKHKLKPGDSRNTQDLSDFRFNEEISSVQERWKVSIEVKNPSRGLVQIKIPAFVPAVSIVAPARTTVVVCQIAIGSLNLKNGQELKKSNIELNFDYNDIRVEEQIISVNLPTPEKSMVVTGVSLHYGILKNDKLRTNTNKAFMPAGIVQVLLV